MTHDPKMVRGKIKENKSISIQEKDYCLNIKQLNQRPNLTNLLLSKMFDIIYIALLSFLRNQTAVSEEL